MTAIIDRLWEKDEPLVFTTKDQYVKNLEGWDFTVHTVDGEPAFVALSCGPVFHFTSLGSHKSLPMKIIRSFLQQLIERYGYAETRTPANDERQHRFNKLLGFVETGRDEYNYVIYRIERLRCRSSQ